MALGSTNWRVGIRRARLHGFIKERDVAAAEMEILEQSAPVHTGGVGGATHDVQAERSRRIKRAIEAYKAACAAEGHEPSEEECWLILLAAVNVPE